jgi:thiamine-monophosphate kinase
MMDVSDGLAKDLRALTPPGTVPVLDEPALPRRHHASLRAALSDGEDYELLFAVATRADRAALQRAWHRRFPSVRLTAIGRFMADLPSPGATSALQSSRGYEHFR